MTNAPVAENPIFIQSRADGTVYEFKFIENATGKYLYADENGNTRILSADDIAEGFHDVTVLETRLRKGLADREAAYEALRDATVCEWFAMCDNAPSTVRKAPWGYVPICDRCNNKVEGMKK